MLVSCPGCGKKVSGRALGDAFRVREVPGEGGFARGLLAGGQKRYPEAVATVDQPLALAPENALVRSLKSECPGEARARLHEIRGGGR